MTGLAQVNEHSDEGIHCHQFLEEGSRGGHLEVGRHVPDFLEKDGGSGLLGGVQEGRERAEEVVELGNGLSDQLRGVTDILRKKRGGGGGGCLTSCYVQYIVLCFYFVCNQATEHQFF